MKKEFVGVRINYQERDAAHILAEELKNFIDDDTIIVNIGTDKCIGDVVAPLVGTMLLENNFPLPVYGTLKSPVHAINLESRLREIKARHPSAKVIGIDACLGHDNCIGDIQLKNGSVSPGKGLGKKLPPVGDISIVGVVDTIDNADLFSIKNIRLDFVMDMSKVIAHALLLATQERRIHREKSEVAVCNF